jgi:hypothetical protein
MEKINKKNVCEICGKTPSEIHHILGRKQGLLNDQLYLIELCQDHHNKHSQTETLKMIFDAQISKYGSHWLSKLIDKIREMQIHKPKELNLAYNMMITLVHTGTTGKSEDYEGE